MLGQKPRLTHGGPQNQVWETLPYTALLLIRALVNSTALNRVPFRTKIIQYVSGKTDYMRFIQYPHTEWEYYVPVASLNPRHINRLGTSE